MATRKVRIEGIAEWAKVFEQNREMTGYKPTPQAVGAYEDCNGACKVDIIMNDENFKRLKASKSVTPGFLIAALLWPRLIDAAKEKGSLNLRKFFRSMDRIIREQQELTAVPRKFHGYIKDIWSLQLKLETRLGHQPYKILNHPRFRAAYDFLLLREEASNDDQGMGDWWTKFQKI